MKSFLKKVLVAVAGLALIAAVGTIGPVQRAIAQGMVNFSPLAGTEQISLNYPCTVSCYITTQQVATFVQTGAATGQVNVAHGGTGASTLTSHGVLVGEGTSAVVGITAGTTGQLLQGATGADPSFATTLSGSYTFSGSNTFTNALNQLGSASGVPSHVSTAQTTAPALTSCGTGSPVITGTDTAGIVTLGTNATGCIITFNVAYTGTPYCVVSWIATPLASQSYVTANTAITLTQTSASGNKVQYICFGTAGG